MAVSDGWNHDLLEVYKANKLRALELTNDLMHPRSTPRQREFARNHQAAIHHILAEMVLRYGPIPDRGLIQRKDTTPWTTGSRS